MAIPRDYDLPVTESEYAALVARDAVTKHIISTSMYQITPQDDAIRKRGDDAFRIARERMDAWHRLWEQAKTPEAKAAVEAQAAKEEARMRKYRVSVAKIRKSNHSRTRFALSDIDLTPTDAMARNAARGLELREKHGKGGTAVGVARARDIKNKANLSPETVKRMHSFFSRHEGNQAGGEDDAGYIAWLLWGGDSGKSWAARKVEQIDKAANARFSHNIAHPRFSELAPHDQEDVIRHGYGIYEITLHMPDVGMHEYRVVAAKSTADAVKYGKIIARVNNFKVTKVSAKKLNSRFSHNIALPKGKRRLNIDEATAALAQMGYRLGNVRYDPAAGGSVYKVTQPNGSVVDMPAAKLTDFIYQKAQHMRKQLNSLPVPTIANPLNHAEHGAAALAAINAAIKSGNGSEARRLFNLYAHTLSSGEKSAAWASIRKMVGIGANFSRTGAKAAFAVTTYEQAEHAIALAEERIHSVRKAVADTEKWIHRANGAMRLADAGNEMAAKEVISIARMIESAMSHRGYSRTGAKAAFAKWEETQTKKHGEPITEYTAKIGRDLWKIDTMPSVGDNYGALFRWDDLRGLRQISAGPIADLKRQAEEISRRGNDAIGNLLRGFSRTGAKAKFSLPTGVVEGIDRGIANRMKWVAEYKKEDNRYMAKVMLADVESLKRIKNAVLSGDGGADHARRVGDMINNLDTEVRGDVGAACIRWASREGGVQIWHSRMGAKANMGVSRVTPTTKTESGGGTWTTKTASYGGKKATVEFYNKNGLVGSVYQDPDNPTQYKAFKEPSGSEIASGSRAACKAAVEKIAMSRTGAKAAFGVSVSQLADELRKVTREAKPTMWHTYANTWLSSKKLIDAETAKSASRAYDIVEKEMLGRMSRTGAKSTHAAADAVPAKVAELIREGVPKDQATAIAFNMQSRGAL